MIQFCDDMCLTLCRDLSSANGTLVALWPCLALLCRVTVENDQMTAFLDYLAKLSVDFGNNTSCTFKRVHVKHLSTWYTVPINGYIAPPIILVTIITNTLVCIVLLKPHMRSSTNTLFIAMALSDMMTGLLPSPVFIHFYATERVNEWIPYNWCYATLVLQYYIPVIFHTVSIWITTALAIQRYICVCHPFKARTWCTMRNVIYGISTIYFFATLIQALKALRVLLDREMATVETELRRHGFSMRRGFTAMDLKQLQSIHQHLLLVQNHLHQSDTLLDSCCVKYATNLHHEEGDEEAHPAAKTEHDE